MEETPELEQSPDVAPPRSRGAQPGNLNAIKHGGRARQERYGFVLARLAERDSAGYQQVKKIRRALERILNERGGITPCQMARIQAACRLEMSCRVCELDIREDKEMSSKDRARLRQLICDWTAHRDAILFELIGDAPASTGKPGSKVASGADPWGLVSGEAPGSQP
jgi:ferredoxin